MKYRCTISLSHIKFEGSYLFDYRTRLAKESRPGSMIICDSLTAQKLPNDDRVRIFPLVSQASIDRLMD
jgi:hypothetical protein